MSKYYRKNILQAAGVAPDTDTSSSSSSSNLTVESTLSMSTDESRPVIGGGNGQLQLETVGNGGGNGQPPKPRSNNTEVHVYVYKNCLECAETDGKKIIEAVELATFDSFQNGGDGGDNDPSAVLKAPLLGGHPATMAGTVKAKEEKAAQPDQQDGNQESRPNTDGNAPIVNEPGMGDVNDGIQVVAERTVDGLLDDKGDEEGCCIKCFIYTMEFCTIM